MSILSKSLSIMRMQDTAFEIKLTISYLIVLLYNPIQLLPVDLEINFYIDVVATAALVAITYLIPQGSLNEVKVPKHNGSVKSIDPSQASRVRSVIITSTGLLGVDHKEERK